MVDILDIEFSDMEGNRQSLRSLGDDNTSKWLVVNVASACGLTKHYAGLQAVSTQEGITVVGFPCNQFGAQEPGTHEKFVDFPAKDMV